MAATTDTEDPLPESVAAPTGAFWATLSRLRRKRIFHPRGGAFDAIVDVPGGARTGVALFDERASFAATVRFSRGAGLPEPLPDVVGIALRIRDAHGAGRHQDFLMNTSLDLPVLHHLMIPVLGGGLGAAYSSILAYRLAGDLALVGAVDRTEEGFRLAVAGVGRRFRPVADVRLGRALPQARADALRFDPWNTGGGIRPAGPFQAARAAAYPGSQRGRAGR